MTNKISNKKKKKKKKKNIRVDKLTEQQKLFAQYYIKDHQFNGTQAAIAAGYSKKTAATQGARLLTRVHIQEYIQSLLRPARKKFDISIERVLQELTFIGFGNVQELFDENGNVKPIHKLSEDTARMLAGIEVEQLFRAGSPIAGGKNFKYKSNDKLKALELLGKYLKMFTENVKVSGGLKVIHDDI